MLPERFIEQNNDRQNQVELMVFMLGLPTVINFNLR